jgi:hypothetical protein
MVSDEDPEVPNESDQDKAARLRRNKAKHVWKQRAEHCQEAMHHYHAALKNYKDEVAQKQLEDEAARDQAVEDQNRRHAKQDRQETRQGVSRNLDQTSSGWLDIMFTLLRLKISSLLKMRLPLGQILIQMIRE